jgi:hypothetical protein
MAWIVPPADLTSKYRKPAFDASPLLMFPKVAAAQ